MSADHGRMSQHTGENNTVVWHWDVPRTRFNEWLDKYPAGRYLFSPEFAISHECSSVPFRLILCPNGYPSNSIYEEGNYSVYLECKEKLTETEKVNGSTVIKLVQCDTHQSEWAFSFGRGSGCEGRPNFGLISDVSSLPPEVTTLTWSIEVKITSVSGRLGLSIESNPNRVLTTWPFSRTVFETTEHGKSLYSPALCEIKYKDRVHMSFGLDFRPNGDTKSKSGYYSLYLVYKTGDESLKQVDVRYTIKLTQCETHSCRDRRLFDAVENVGWGRSNFGCISDVRSLSSDIETLVFAIDVEILSTVPDSEDLNALSTLKMMNVQDHENALEIIKQNGLVSEPEYWASVPPGRWVSWGMSWKDVRILVNQSQMLPQPMPPQNFYILPIERDEMRELKEQLTELQPTSDLKFPTPEFYQSFSRNNLPRILECFDQLKDLVEKEKAQLITNPMYFESMLRLKEHRKFEPYKGSDQIYEGIWRRLSAKEEWDNQIDRILEFSAKYSRMTPQEVRSIVDIYPLCVILQNNVNEIIGELGKMCGLTDPEDVYSNGVKSLYRAFMKSAFDFDRPYEANLWDWARGLLSFNNLDGVYNALELFCDKERFPNVTIENITCGFRKYSDGGPDTWRGGAWQDVKVHFVLENMFPRILCELQLCHRTFTTARRELGGHDDYAKFRFIFEAERYVVKFKERLMMCNES